MTHVTRRDFYDREPGGSAQKRCENRSRVRIVRNHGTETSLRAAESKPRLSQSLQEECHPGELFWTFSNHNCKIMYAVLVITSVGMCCSCHGERMQTAGQRSPAPPVRKGGISKPQLFVL